MLPDEPDTEHDFKHPISNGPNARPRDEPIGQSERGLPDDSGRAVEIASDEETKIAGKILGTKTDASDPR